MLLQEENFFQRCFVESKRYLLRVVGLEFFDNFSFSREEEKEEEEGASRYFGLLRIDLMWFIANRAALTALKYWCMRCQKYPCRVRGSSRSHVWIVTTQSWNIRQREGEREGGSTVDLKTGKRFYSSEFLSIPPLLCIFNSIEFIAKYVWTVIRMDGGRNEELSEFLARILSIIFPTLPVSSIRSLLNRLSTRFSRSAARRKRHSVIFF